MDLKTATAMLDNLIFTIEHSANLVEGSALLIVIEFFRTVFAQGSEFTLRVLEHLVESVVT